MDLNIYTKFVLYRKGNKKNIPIILKNNKSTESSEGEELVNNTLNLKFYFDKEIMVEKLNSGGNKLIFSKKDLIEMFVYNQGTNIDITKSENIFKTFILKSWTINYSDKTISFQAVDSEYELFNQNFSGTYGVNLTDNISSFNSNIVTLSSNYDKNKYIYQTFQYFYNSKLYCYVILENENNTITLHKNIPTSHTFTTFYIGYSSPNVIKLAIDELSRDRIYGGETKFNLQYTFLLGDKYEKGIQLIRPDSEAFPIVTYQSLSNPINRVIQDLSQRDFLSKPNELLSNRIIFRNYILRTSFDLDSNKYSIDWFYINVPNIRNLGNSFTISNDTLKFILVNKFEKNAFINKLITIGKEKYYVKSNTENEIILNRKIINYQNEFACLLYEEVDFVLNEKDIIPSNTKLGLGPDDSFNFVSIKGGQNPFTKILINLRQENENSTLTTFKHKEFDFSFLSNELITLIGIENITKDNIFTTENISFPYTFPNFRNVEGNKVTNKNEFINEFTNLIRKVLQNIKEDLFANSYEYKYKGTISLNGFKQFINNNFNKTYQVGSRLYYSNEEFGIYNEKDPNGKYLFEIKSLSYNIINKSWVVNLNVEEVIFFQTKT